jgi:hypothetical protein
VKRPKSRYEAKVWRLERHKSELATSFWAKVVVNVDSKSEWNILMRHIFNRRRHIKASWGRYLQATWRNGLYSHTQLHPVRSHHHIPTHCWLYVSVSGHVNDQVTCRGMIATCMEHGTKSIVEPVGSFVLNAVECKRTPWVRKPTIPTERAAKLVATSAARVVLRFEYNGSQLPLISVF